MSSIPSAVTTLPTILRTLLTETADRLAHAHGLVQRTRTLTGAAFAQTLVLNRLAPAADGAARTVPLPVSESAWSERFTPAAIDFCRALLAETITTVVCGSPADAPLLAAFPAVVAIDSTTIALPDAMRDVFPACGGRGKAQGRAALKAHVGLEVRSGRVLGPLLTPGRSADRPHQPSTATLPVGTLLLRDLGYWSLTQFRAERAAGMHLITRVKPQTTLFTADGVAQSLSALLTAQPATTTHLDLPVQVGRQIKLPMRLVARRVDPAIAARRLAMATATAKRKHGARAIVHPETIAGCAWDVVLTSLSAEQVAADAIWVLWRVRWRVEQLFKHWKSMGQIARSTARKAERVTCEIVAGVIAMLLAHWMQVAAVQDQADIAPVDVVRVVRRFVRRIGAAMARGHGLARVIRALVQAIRAAPRRPRRSACPYQFQQWDLPLPESAASPP